MSTDKTAVYFTDFRTKLDVSQGTKLQNLCRRAGIGRIDFADKFVAIKMHFGELGNFAYLRPNYVKAVADLIRELGGKPFLTDCNTLSPGSRKNAVDHLYNAEVNGFNSVTTGCYVIIGDGLKGTDDIAVAVPGGEYCREAYIGRALYDADIIISLNHFKGHEMAGFGGAVKIWAWAEAAGPGRCSSTVTESRLWIRTCAAPAVNAQRNAGLTQSPMRPGKHTSCRISVRAAAAASVPAPSMQSVHPLIRRQICWAVRWRNIPLQLSPANRTFISR